MRARTAGLPPTDPLFFTLLPDGSKVYVFKIERLADRRWKTACAYEVWIADEHGAYASAALMTFRDAVLNAMLVVWPACEPAEPAYDEGSILADLEKMAGRATPKQHAAILGRLLDGITPENTHPEVDFGPPVGEEFGA